MAPTHTAVAALVAVSTVDSDPARRAAESVIQPHKTPEQIANDLLERLRKAKRRRELRGLNQSFFQAERERAVSRATAMLGNREDAEELVAETFLELAEGRTAPGHFYRALWANLLNRWEKTQKQAASFVSIEKVVMSAAGPGAADSEAAGAPDAVEDFASTRLEDQDPLDIMIAREEREASRLMVEAAMQDPRWRYIKRRDWAAGLEENVRN